MFVLSVAYKKNIAPLLGATLSVFYAILSYQAGFYANAVMNLFVLVPLQLWGTWYWFKKKDEINTLNKSQISLVSVLTVIGIIISTFFAFKSGSKLPYLDGISSVLIITGTVLLTFKTKEQWYAWIPY
ncbi:nicotinamide riboside transporter PnuC, partial [Herbiconiux daphne]